MQSTNSMYSYTEHSVNAWRWVFKAVFSNSFIFLVKKYEIKLVNFFNKNDETAKMLWFSGNFYIHPLGSGNFFIAFCLTFDQKVIYICGNEN